MRDSKNYVIAALCLVLCVMAVGFAAFSAQIDVGGTASIGSTWDVKIPEQDGVVCVNTVADGGAAESVTSTGTRVSGTNATLAMGFTQPGDSVTCTIKVKNTGTIKAVANALTVNVNSEEFNQATQTGPIRFTVSGITNGTTLAATTGENTLTVVGEYLSTETGQPDAADLTKTISISFGYVQDFS